MNKIIKIILFLAFTFSIAPVSLLANDKIKIGLLVPLTGKNSEIGQSIIKSTRLAINIINNASIEIIPKDTQSNPEVTLIVAKELANSGIKIVIGPVFNKSLIYLDELNELTFLALTNKNDNFSKNIINAGINATSQLNAIKKFIELNEIKKTIFLTPDVSFKNEIEKAISNSKIKMLENYIYNTDPTKLTKQIEKITRYDIRKQNLEDEINRLKKSEQNNKERLIERLEKRDTLGSVKFDSLVISDFDESLKSVTTSLLYTDISPKEKYFITLNQWFDESLLKETSSQPIYFPSANKDN
ncbi:ABC transporter substrate-binding protein, partial [Candidatus Pelagibacter sp.]|nr:ABC transporter substrate-binding protein [Candidatus Pelagibacter sp.]